tara:strand:- start:2138 stop:3718 length:1581 start_codon:yes stop_codon:yes gene_type:complete
MNNFFSNIKYLSYQYFESAAKRDEQIESALHQEVINSFLKLRKFIPTHLQNKDIENIILSKGMVYNTGMDKSVRQYFYTKKAMYKFSRNKKLSQFVSSKIIDLKDQKLKDSMIEKKFEEGVDLFSSIENKHKNFESNALFFASQESHLKVFQSFFEKTELDSISMLVPKKLSKNFCGLKKEINLIFLEDFFDTESNNSFKRNIEEFESIFYKNELEIKKIFSFQGKEFYSQHRFGLLNIFKYLMPQSLLFIEASKKAITEINPKRVIGTRTRRIFDRAVFQNGQKQGINTFILFHSTPGMDCRELWTSGIYNNVDYILGWGESHKELFEKRELNFKGQFIKVGSPLFSMPPKKRTIQNIQSIIYASTRNDHLVIETLKKFKALNPNIKITIKIRPGQKIPSSLNTEIFEVESGDFPIEDILEKFDLFITTYSGSHIAAMSQGIPVIFAPFYFEFSYDLNSLYKINKERMSYAYTEKPKELIKVINKLMTSFAYREKLIAQQGDYLKELLENYSNEESIQKIDQILK